MSAAQKAHSLISVAVKSWSTGAASANEVPAACRRIAMDLARSAARGRSVDARAARSGQRNHERARATRLRQPASTASSTVAPRFRARPRANRRTGCCPSGAASPRTASRDSFSRRPPARRGCRVRRATGLRDSRRAPARQAWRRAWAAARRRRGPAQRERPRDGTS